MSWNWGVGGGDCRGEGLLNEGEEVGRKDCYQKNDEDQRHPVGGEKHKSTTKRASSRNLWAGRIRTERGTSMR